MGDDITIGVTEIVNNIEVTAQPSDQVIEIDVVDNSDDVTLNITPTVIEININKGSSFARWGTILGNLPDQADLQNVLNLKADLVGGLVPASQLPSYVDDIVEVANYAALPVVGETGKIYLTLDNNKIYRWSGSVYIEVAANNAIWGAITGTLSSQTDLQTALDTKALKTITITPNAPLSGGGDLSANRTISISQSNATTDGYLSSTDWITFNGKADDALVVHKAGSETITGIKTFTGSSTIFDYTGASRLVFKADGTDTAEFSFGATFTQITSKASDGYLFKNSAGSNSLTISNAGAGTFLSSLTATSFIKTGGTSNQYLKADGSVSTLTNPITGTGTINYLPKFTASGTIGISNIIDNGSFIDVLTGAVIAGNLNVNGVISSGTPSNTLSIASGSGAIFVKNSASNTAYAFQLNTSSGLDLWSTNSGGTSTRRLTLDSSGNLGIGTTSPSEKLSVVGGNISLGAGYKLQYSSTAYITPENNVSGAEIATGGILTIKTGGTTERVRVDASGNVGIGTTSPTNSLSIKTISSVIAGIDFNYSIDNSVAGKIGYNQSNDTLSINNNSSFASGGINFSTAGSERMRITSGGNVGIGTTSPTRALDVNGSIALSFNGETQIVNDQRGTDSISIRGASNINFHTFNGSSMAERMRITSGGDVAIGGTSGVGRVQIWGNSVTSAGYSLVTYNSSGFTLFSARNDGLLNFGTYGNAPYNVTTGAAANAVLNSNGEMYRSTSSLKYKKNVENYTKGLNEIMQMRPVTYNSKNESEDGVLYAGLIAEEIHDLGLTEFVQYANDGTPDALAYSNMVSLLIKGIQELKAEIEILKNK